MVMDVIKDLSRIFEPPAAGEVKIGFKRYEVLSVQEGIDNGVIHYRAISNGQISIEFVPTDPNSKHRINEKIITNPQQRTAQLQVMAGLCDKEGVIPPQWFERMRQKGGPENVVSLP